MTDTQAGRAETPSTGWTAGPGSRLVVNIVLLLVGAGCFVLALQLELWRGDRPGAGFYPALASGLFLLCLGADTIRQLVRMPAARRTGAASTRLPWQVLIVLGMIAVYLVLVGIIGHLLVTIAIVVVLLKVLGTRPWWQIAIIAGATAFGTDYLFGELLGVRLDDGLLGIGLSSWM